MNRMQQHPPHEPGTLDPSADTLLHITQLHHGGERGEAHVCSKSAFVCASPSYERVMALRPGETMILGGGAAGAWEVRCLTEDEAAMVGALTAIDGTLDVLEADRESEATDQRRALATAGFHERMARHLEARGRQGEAERARESAGRLRGKDRS